ncbi:MAG: hypothetical protein OXI66_18065 [Boseongicola sp.]|nr:hypothetical protein [Boseongicola sp.]
MDGADRRHVARVEPMLPGKATDPGVTAADSRKFSRRCPGGSARDRLGATFRSASAT